VRLFKGIDVALRNYNILQRLQKRAEELVLENISYVDKKPLAIMSRSISRID